MARAGNRIEIPETAQEFINREAIIIEIVNPKAKQLIKDLANMKLINISKSATSRISDFKKLLAKLRSNSDTAPSLEEITKEVELVRAKRYAKKSK